MFWFVGWYFGYASFLFGTTSWSSRFGLTKLTPYTFINAYIIIINLIQFIVSFSSLTIIIHTCFSLNIFLRSYLLGSLWDIWSTTSKKSQSRGACHINIWLSRWAIVELFRNFIITFIFNYLFNLVGIIFSIIELDFHNATTQSN